MKVIFLDVMGVLVHSETVHLGDRTGESWNSSFYHAATVDPACVLRVRRIIDATEARIVVASDWRRHDFQVTALRRAFLTSGVDRLALRTMFTGNTPLIDANRTAEVSAWLAEHHDVTKYVILNDDPVAGHPQVYPLPSFHHGGLLDVHVEEAIRLLT